MLKITMFLLVLLSVPFANANDTAEVKELKKDMPQDVVEMISRTVECNRWIGEEPTTKERIERVKKELNMWKCESIDVDRAVLAKRYDTNYIVKLRLQKAKDIY